MKKALLALFVSVAAAQPPGIDDVLLKGGQVIDPKNRRNERLDIAIAGGRIRQIGKDLPAAHARQVVDVSGYYVTPGLVDLHAHFVSDHNTLRYGVTTVVNANAVAARDFEQAGWRVKKHSRARVLALLSADGAKDMELASMLARKHTDAVAGILAPAAAVREPDMLQVGDCHGEQNCESVARQLRRGDLLTRLYGRPIEGGFEDARARGILLGASQGADGLWFRIAVPAIRRGFLPDVISSGLDEDSVLLPRATMTHVMSKFLAMGMTLEQVIERTTASPARAIRRADLGAIKPGGVADLAVFALEKGTFGFLDSGHAKLTADRSLRCVLTVRNGEIVWDTEGLSLTDWKRAGPYSNFK